MERIATNYFVLVAIMVSVFVVAGSTVQKLIDMLKRKKSKRCYFCHKDDQQIFPVIITEGLDQPHLEWICRRDLRDGLVAVDAYTGMPIFMTGEHYPGLPV